MADDSAASRLAALRQHPEVRLRLNEVLWYGKNLGLPTGTVCEGGRTWRETFDSEVDALLSAVAAAATAQTKLTDKDAATVAEWAYALAQSDKAVSHYVPTWAVLAILGRLGALAGGAPPQREGMD